MARREGTVTLLDFICESNRIEGLHHEPTQAEISAHAAFLVIRTVTVADLECFVSLIQPGAVLRRRQGQNVVVGRHRPPLGGPEIEQRLDVLLSNFNLFRLDVKERKAYRFHCQYESLHPFMDGNGRSGRVLWLWMMGGLDAVPLGFLHHWYYQSLNAYRHGREAL